MDRATICPENNFAVPASFEEIERLVQRLYLPGTPQQITRIQHVLQNMQRSPQGWSLADALLYSQDVNVRFFGALTFTIKINTDWSSLGEDSTALLERLLSWLVRLVSENEVAMVVRKLCSALVAYFLQSGDTWLYCIPHVLCCFKATSVVSQESITQSLLSSNQIYELDLSQVTTTLWFAMMLVEEASKIAFDSNQTHHIQERVSLNLAAIAQLLRFILDLDPALNGALVQEGVKCCQSWVMYAQRAWSIKDESTNSLRVLTPRITKLVETPSMFDVSQDFLTDVLVNFPAFFELSDYKSLMLLLCSPTAETYSSKLTNGDFDSGSSAYARLLLAFGDAQVQELARSLGEPSNSCVMDQLVGLLMCQGYAVVEDEICPQAMEFWITYAEHLLDDNYEELNKRPSWTGQAVQYLMKAIQAAWNKIRMPPPEEVETLWDQDTKTSIAAFRADVEELISSAHVLLGIGLFEYFAQLALEALANGAWYHLEATIFCLNALAEAVAEKNTGDQVLLRLFGSDMFYKLADSAASVPSKTQQTALDMIYWYTPFFQRHTEYLPQTLNFLFTCLKVPELATSASKAVLETCDNCRTILTGELGAFVQQYDELRKWNGRHPLEAVVKEKVIGAIASIVQAVPLEKHRLEYLNQLLYFVAQDVEISVQSLHIGQLEDAKAIGLHALNCLGRIGKAMRVPDGVPVDLEADDASFGQWTAAKSDFTRERVIHLYQSVFLPLRSDNEIVEATCQILRSGYTESTPGPFVFPASATVEVVMHCDISTPGFGYALEAAGIMLSGYRTKISDETKEASMKLYHHCLLAIRAMDANPNYDPEVARSCIHFAENLLPYYLDTLFDNRLRAMVPSLFLFSLQCLTAADIMPKRSSASFWTSLVSIQGHPPQTQDLITATMQDYGPQLVSALIQGIGGEAARSELDTLSDPLRKLILKQPRSKQWLTDALASDSFPSKLVGDAEKRKWLQKIWSLRGARGTNQAVKEFWMSCRGTSLAFAS